MRSSLGTWSGSRLPIAVWRRPRVRSSQCRSDSSGDRRGHHLGVQLRWGADPHDAPAGALGSARLRHTSSASPPPHCHTIACAFHKRPTHGPDRSRVRSIPSPMLLLHTWVAAKMHGVGHRRAVGRTCACRNKSVHVVMFHVKMCSMAVVLCMLLWPVALVACSITMFTKPYQPS